MKITDLPQDIRERAEANVRTIRGGVKSKNLEVSFSWNLSPEGSYFWILVNEGKFEEARALLNGKNDNP